jgi:hypothetical protein
MWWLFLSRLWDVHRTNDIAQHVGKCDNPQQSTLLTALSFFPLEASIHQWICPREIRVKNTNLPFDDNQAMYTPLLDQL